MRTYQEQHLMCLGAILWSQSMHAYVCMHVCTTRMHECMRILCMYNTHFSFMHECMYVYVYMYTCMHACMHVCICICIYIYIYDITHRYVFTKDICTWPGCKHPKANWGGLCARVCDLWGGLQASARLFRDGVHGLNGTFIRVSCMLISSSYCIPSPDLHKDWCIHEKPFHFWKLCFQTAFSTFFWFQAEKETSTILQRSARILVMLPVFWFILYFKNSFLPWDNVWMPCGKCSLPELPLIIFAPDFLFYITTTTI